MIRCRRRAAALSGMQIGEGRPGRAAEQHRVQFGPLRLRNVGTAEPIQQRAVQ